MGIWIKCIFSETTNLHQPKHGMENQVCDTGSGEPLVYCLFMFSACKSSFIKMGWLGSVFWFKTCPHFFKLYQKKVPCFSIGLCCLLCVWNVTLRILIVLLKMYTFTVLLSSSTNYFEWIMEICYESVVLYIIID